MTGECFIWDFSRESGSLFGNVEYPARSRGEGEIQLGEILNPLLLLLLDTKHPQK